VLEAESVEKVPHVTPKTGKKCWKFSTLLSGFLHFKSLPPKVV
jgi:hypothetical protein